MSKTYRYIKRYLAVALVIGLSMVSGELGATHIVGSDMSFRCLGNNFYEVTLTVRRDCINGADDAPFDDPASIGVFDAHGNLLDWIGTFGQVLIPFDGKEIVTPNRPDCGYFGGPVCVEQATYVGRVYLPFRSGGYVLAYQRCCRNVTLNNIVSPLETGTTKFVCLTERTLTECNSSPEFHDWPEMVVCSDAPLTFEHMATDADGDSLAYKLYTPHAGATIDFPRPQPPRYNPYDTIQWAQGYDLSNLLGSGEPLTVDPVTGTIQSVPGLVGQYLVGILVEEWRDGELLSKVRRDFEYNVRVCDDVANIDFDTDDLVCDGLTVTVNNTSADNFGYTWNFNYPSEDPKFISTETSPSFTYDHPGTYKISLSSTHPNNNCESIIIEEVSVYESDIDLDFEVIAGECTDDMINVRLIATAIENDTSGQIETVEWIISSDGVEYTAQGADVAIEIPCLGLVDITARAISTTGCDESLTKAVDLGDGSGIDDLGLAGDTLAICVGESVALIADAKDNLTYTWTPTDGLVFTDTVRYSDPVASPSSDITYTVMATDGVNSASATVLVTVDEYPVYEIDRRSFDLCEGDAESISITSDQALTYVWRPADDIDLTDPTNPIFTNRANRTYHVDISNGGCTVTDSVVITIIPTEVGLVEDDIVYSIKFDSTSNGLTASINAQELIDKYDITSIRWEVIAGDQTYSGTGSDIDITVPSDASGAKITYFFSDSQGCEYMIMTTVTRSGSDGSASGFIDLAGDTLRICIGESVALFSSAKDGITYTWSPLDALTFTDTVRYSDPVASPTVDMAYKVTATDGVIDTSASVLVIVDMMPEYTIAGDTLQHCEGSSTGLDIVSEQNLTYSWTPTDGIDQTNPAHPVFTTTTSAMYYVTITNGECVVMDSVYVDVIPTEVSEVEASAPFNVGFDEVSRNFSADIGLNGALDSFDVRSIRWEVLAGDAVFAGNGTKVDVPVPSDIEEVKLIYFITDSQGCEYMVMKLIDLNDINMPPIINFIMQDTIIACVGDSVRIIANPNSAWTYTWTPETGLYFDTDRSNPLFVGDSSQQYIVSVTDGLSTSVDTIYVLRTDRMMMLSFDHQEGTICEGTTTQRVNNPQGSDATLYEWALDPDFTTLAATGQEVSIPIDGDLATIYVRATDPLYCGSNVASLTVRKDTIDVSASYGALDYCDSDAPMTDVVITNNNPEKDVIITWDASDRIGSDRLDTNVVTIASEVTDTVIVLSYTASDGIGCIVSGEVRVPVLGNIVPEINPDGTVSCAGPINLSVSSNVSDATYEWALTSDFAEIIATGASASLGDMPRPVTIYVRGAHPDYCVSAVDSTRIESGMSDVTAEYAPLNTCVSRFTEVTITSASSEIASVMWTSSDNIASNPVMQPISVVALPGQERIVLYYTATSSEGCAHSDSVEIDVLEMLTVDIVADSVSCDGAMGTFAAEIDAATGTYEWSFDADYSTVISTDSIIMTTIPDGGRLYLRATAGSCTASTSVSADDFKFEITTDAPSDICVGDTLVITADGGDREFSINWAPNPNIISSTDTSVTIVGRPGEDNISLIYIGRSTDGCSSSGRVELDYSTIMIPDPQVSVECGTYGITFSTSGFEDGDILWSYGDQSVMGANPAIDFGAAGMYTVNVTSLQSTCAFDDFSIEVEVPEILDLSTTSDQMVSMCAGGDTTMTVNAITNSGYPIIWTSEAGDTLARGDTTLTFTSKDYMMVIATVSDTFGCSESITFEIANDALNPMVTFPGLGDGAACPGQAFDISISDSLRSNLMVQWLPADVIQSGQGTETVTVILDQPTTITAIVTDTVDGCMTELTIEPVINAIDVMITTDDDDDEFCRGETMMLFAESDAVITSYEWSTGETTESIEISPTETTTYTVTVTDENGCVATDEITVEVTQPLCNDSDIFIPTAFSPNNDGQNDELYVRSKFVQTIDFHVLNRWGQEVFRTNDQSVGWNGRMKNTGKELSPDVYAFCAVVTCIDGQEYMVTGNVSLIR